MQSIPDQFRNAGSVRFAVSIHIAWLLYDHCVAQGLALDGSSINGGRVVDYIDHTS